MSLSGTKCSKLLVIFCNVFFSWISGVVLVLFGVAYLYDPSYLNYYTLIALNDYPSYIFIILSLSVIALGGFIITLGLFGCFGTLCESPCMLKTYVYCLVLVFLLETGFAAGSLFLHLSLRFREIEVEQSMMDGFNKFYGSPNSSLLDFNSAMDFTQAELKCCGMQNYTDFDQAEWQNWVGNPDNKVPSSCCSKTPILQYETEASLEGLELDRVTETTSAESWAKCQSGDPMESDQYLYVQGCWPQLKGIYSTNTLFAAILFASLALLQMLGVIFPVCWISRLERKIRRIRRSNRQSQPLL